MTQEPLQLGTAPLTTSIPKLDTSPVTEKRGPGQPTKMTEATLALLRHAFSIDATVEEACFYAGIHPATYYRFKEREPEYCEQLERLRLNPILTARQTIVNGLGSSDNAKWYIERKRSEEFSTKTKTEHSGKIDGVEGAGTETLRVLADEFEEKMKAALIAGIQAKP